MARKFSNEILDLIESTSRNLRAAPLNLGGVSGLGGGEGGPPGGFIGMLPQTRVAYDEDEIASSGFLYSGISLLDNLNHIRYRLGIIESGGGFGSGITIVDDNNSLTYTDIDTIHFIGSGVLVTDLGGGEVQVEIDAVGSGGVNTFLDLSDTPNSYGGQANKFVTVNSLETELEFTTPAFVEEAPINGNPYVRQDGGWTLASGITSSGQELHKYNEDHTSQIITQLFTTELVYASGTLRVYYNGLRQRKNYDYSELPGFITYSTYFTTYSGDVMIVDYDYLESDQFTEDTTHYLIDSDAILIVDSDGNQLTESL